MADNVIQLRPCPVYVIVSAGDDEDETLFHWCWTADRVLVCPNAHEINEVISALRAALVKLDGRI